MGRKENRPSRRLCEKSAWIHAGREGRTLRWRWHDWNQKNAKRYRNNVWCKRRRTFWIRHGPCENGSDEKIHISRRIHGVCKRTQSGRRRNCRTLWWLARWRRLWFIRRQLRNQGHDVGGGLPVRWSGYQRQVHSHKDAWEIGKDGHQKC